MLSLLALLRFSLIKFKEWSGAQLASFATLLNLPTSLLYHAIFTGYQSAVGINTKQLSSASALSLVQLLHTSLSCFILLFSPSRSLRSASNIRVFRVPRMARKALGIDPFSISDLWSVTLLPCLSGILLHSRLLSQNWNPIPSLLRTYLSCCFLDSINWSPVMNVFDL